MHVVMCCYNPHCVFVYTMQILQNILHPGPKLLVISEARGLSQMKHSTGATTSTSLGPRPMVSKDASYTTFRDWLGAAAIPEDMWSTIVECFDYASEGVGRDVIAGEVEIATTEADDDGASE